MVPGSTEDRRLVIMCPVCREPIEDVRLREWISAPRPHLEHTLEDFKMTPQLERLQKKMKKLYLRQKERGSLIDVEAESKKYLVSTSSVSAEGEPSMNSNVVKNVTVQSGESKAHETVPPHSQDGASTKKKGRNRHSKKQSSEDDSVVESYRDQEQPHGGGRHRGGRGRGRGHHRYQNQKGARKSEGYKGNSEAAKSERS